MEKISILIQSELPGLTKGRRSVKYLFEDLDVKAGTASNVKKIAIDGGYHGFDPHGIMQMSMAISHPKGGTWGDNPERMWAFLFMACGFENNEPPGFLSLSLDRSTEELAGLRSRLLGLVKQIDTIVPPTPTITSEISMVIIDDIVSRDSSIGQCAIGAGVDPKLLYEIIYSECPIAPHVLKAIGPILRKENPRLSDTILARIAGDRLTVYPSTQSQVLKPIA